MGSPYVGEIRMFAGTFAPAGWAFCNGQQLSTADNSTLYALIGNTYGGTDQSFNVPDLRSRVPLHVGTGSGNTYVLGLSGGVETVSLTSQQVGAHNHAAMALNSGGSTGAPAGNVLAQPSASVYETQNPPTVNLGGNSISTTTGGGQPHANIQPYLAINFIISLFGLYPSQN